MENKNQVRETFEARVSVWDTGVGIDAIANSRCVYLIVSPAGIFKRGELVKRLIPRGDSPAFLC